MKYLNMKTPDDKRIKILSRIFGTNLEKLKCSVTAIDDIVIVLNRMRKLWSFGIECNGRMNHEEVLSWMMQNIPRLKNFTHRIRTISETRVCLWLWISCN